MNTTILKVVVGSQAHGLAGPNSDFDYRGVFVVPTTEILKIGGHTEQTSWIEGNEDDTSWEIGKFLNMAMHCNPTILETFLSPYAKLADPTQPVIDGELSMRSLRFGEELRSLFTYVWNANDVKNAFIGYGINQRKKFFDNKDKRAPKYAAAYLRVLYNAWELLSTGTFNVDLRNTEIYDQVKRFKSGEFTHGEVIESCWSMETRVLKAFESCKKESDVRPVNDFLLKVRKEFWK